MRVLELGSYIIPAYAGMLLAEQGAHVEKWHSAHDPIQSLQHGDDLWRWLNHKKTLIERSAAELATLTDSAEIDVVIDNFRPETLQKLGLDPVVLAHALNCVWVSMRSEIGDTSFDMLAQMRSTAEIAGYLPFYLGDTSGGLWLAFKALAAACMRAPGHYVLGQATCLQKLIEGELVVTPKRTTMHRPIWDETDYFFDEDAREGVVRYKGREYREPVRDRTWKLAHLWHTNGRMRI